jgi:beta-glucosidase
VKSNILFQAVEKARAADIAIVFVGQTTSFAGEGAPKGYFDISKQSSLIKSIYEVNPNTIVVMQTVSPAEIEDWAFNIPAIIEAGIPRQESGAQIAQVLFGLINPAAKLPYTWVMNENQNFETRFPFGHGLSYTTFGIGKLMMRRNRDGSGWVSTVEIKNVGSREGTEVLQLYIVPPERKKHRTDKKLSAYKSVHLYPGQKKIVSIPVPYEAFGYIDEEAGEWRVDPGLYKILVGTSEEDIKLQKIIEIKESHLNP